MKIFLPAFRIQSEILTDFRILQLQLIADSSMFSIGPGFKTLRVIEYFCLDFGLRALEAQIWLKNHNGSADLHTLLAPFDVNERSFRF